MSNCPVNDLICRFIRHERMRRRRQVQEIADVSGIPISSYASLEAGRYRLNPATLLRIQLALRCPIDRLWPFGYWNVCRVTDNVLGIVVRETEKRLSVPPTLDDILEATWHVTGIEAEALASGSRHRDIMHAKTVAAWLVAQTPEIVMNDLARHCGIDPSSLSHTLARAKRKAEKDAVYAHLLRSAEKWLKRVVREAQSEKYDTMQVRDERQIRP